MCEIPLLKSQLRCLLRQSYSFRGIRLRNIRFAFLPGNSYRAWPLSRRSLCYSCPHTRVIPGVGMCRIGSIPRDHSAVSSLPLISSSVAVGGSGSLLPLSSCSSGSEILSSSQFPWLVDGRPHWLCPCAYLFTASSSLYEAEAFWCCSYF